MAMEQTTGDYLSFIGECDELSQHALYWMADEILKHPETKMIFSDEDKIDVNGKRFDPYFKPDWNPDLLLGQNYICHLAAYRRQRVLDIGGFTERLGIDPDWDLSLRFTDDPKMSIRHVPSVLYHRRQTRGKNIAIRTKQSLLDSQQAVTDYLQRKNELVKLEIIEGTNYLIPHFQLRGEPLVSIIIPTRNGLNDLHKCIESLKISDYTNVEILIIDNQSDDPDTLAFLSEISGHSDCRVLLYPYPFHYAAIHNWAVPQCKGEYICLLNNDTEVLAPNWLKEMLSQAQRPEIGAVGAKLIYSDGTIQHAGVVLGMRTIASHAHKKQDGKSIGYYGRAALVQNFSAVTAACLVMRKSLWKQVGGMSNDLAVAYNDVDLCLRIRETGLRNIWLPQALLYHHESKSRGSDMHPEKWRRFALEHAYMLWRWGVIIRNDPAYNPNLTLEREDFSLAKAPRVSHPWKKEAIIFDVPYGVKPDLFILENNKEIRGSFPLPVGISGTLVGISIRIFQQELIPKGTLFLDICDEKGSIALASLGKSQDNSMAKVPFKEGKILLQGQDRLFFSIRLEGAEHPVILRSYLLNERWGHQIAGHENLGFRIELEVLTHAS